MPKFLVIGYGRDIQIMKHGTFCLCVHCVVEGIRFEWPLHSICKGLRMKFSRLAVAAAAGSLVLAPVAVTAQTNSNEDAGGSDVVRAAIIAAIAAVGMVTLLVTEDDDEERPVSP